WALRSALRPISLRAASSLSDELTGSRMRSITRPFDVLVAMLELYLLRLACALEPELLDPFLEELHGRTVDLRRRQRRHLAGAAACQPLQKHRALRTARGHQGRVGDLEGIVLRADAEELHLARLRGELQVDRRVAAAGQHVALRTVGVQIRAGPGAQV